MRFEEWKDRYYRDKPSMSVVLRDEGMEDCWNAAFSEAQRRAMEIAQQEGCNHSGCGQGMHSLQCPIGIGQAIEEMKP
jgi:hypothetical protein